MPAYERRGDSDTPELVADAPAPRKRGGRRLKAEPSADPADDYYAFSDPTAAMAVSAIIGPAGLGTGISN
jgi:hypothetical protein